MRLGIVAVLFLCSLQTASAASLYLDPNSATLFRGDAITVGVRLDTDEAAGECINTVDGTITYDESITAVDISIGRSILPIWIEPPTINKEKRTITFAGGIPNGYCGRVQGDPNLTNVLLELVFRAPGMQVGGGSDRSTASVQFAPETTAYINDGLGTKAALKTYGLVIALNDSAGTEILDPWSGTVQNDTIPPEAFSISLEKGETSFGGDYYIVFNTTDKQTGLDFYEVIEESVAESKLFNFGAATSPWIKARSPYVLKDQSLRSVLRVKAIDKAGNEYVATLIPDPSLQKVTEIYWLTVSILGFAFIVTIIALLFYQRRRKHNRQLAVTPKDE